MPRLAAGRPLSRAVPVDAARLDLHRVHLQLRRPHVTAHGTETVRDVILASWTDADGVTGWGECPTLSTFGYANEITDTAWRFLCDVVGPGFERGGALPEVDGAHMAMAAVRDAVLDARLRRAGRPLRDEVCAAHDGALEELDTSAPVEMPWRWVIGLDDELPAGAGRLKVKVTPEHLGRLRTWREQHPDIDLAADANGSFAAAGDVPDWIDELGLAYLEQPLPPADLAGLAALRGRVRTDIALDESIVDRRSLHRAIDLGAVDVVSLKPARVGGVERAIELAEIALDAELGAFVGGMLETGIGRAAALGLTWHPVVADGPFGFDLGPSDQYFDRDVTEPIARVIRPDGDAAVVLPEGPGIGREPLPDRLAECTVDRATFAATG